MTYQNFIPQVWSRSLLSATDTALVYGAEGVISRDYEGEITSGGDTVKINSLGDPTVKSYDRTTDIDAAEDLTNAQQMLLIDQEKYFNFAISDIDKAQANTGLMAEASTRGGYQLKKTADSFLSALASAGVASGNIIAATDVGTGASDTPAYELLVDLGVLLDESDVPEDARWVAVSPAFHGLLRKDDRFVGFGTDGTKAALTNGKIGEAAGFTVMKTNQAPVNASSAPTIIAGHRMAWNFAQQLLEVEAYRPERRFSDAVKALHVYGAKVTRPTFLAKCEVTINA